MSALTATVVAGAGRSPAPSPELGSSPSPTLRGHTHSGCCACSASSSPDTLVEAADATGGRVVVAEDHHPEGGLGSAVVAAPLDARVQQLRLAHLSVSELPGSGTTAELLAAAGIDATHIASAAAALIDE